MSAELMLAFEEGCAQTVADSCRGTRGCPAQGSLRSTQTRHTTAYQGGREALRGSATQQRSQKSPNNPKATPLKKYFSKAYSIGSGNISKYYRFFCFFSIPFLKDILALTISQLHRKIQNGCLKSEY